MRWWPILLTATVALTSGCTTGPFAGRSGGGASDLQIGPPATTPGQAVAEELPGKQSAALCITMAESLEKDGKEVEAIPYFERARHLDPSLNERATRRLAVLYDRQDDQSHAMAEFQELLKRRPKDPSLLNDVGYSYYNRAQWAEAESYLRRAVTADKNNKRAWVNLGMALAQQGKYQEGLDAFEKAVTTAEAHANLAFVLATQGKSADALASYRKALTFEPTLRVAQAAVAKLEANPEPVTLPPSVKTVQAAGGS